MATSIDAPGLPLTLVQELPVVIVGTHCCLIMDLDHTSAKIRPANVMCAEYIWNVSVLLGVHISNLVSM
jgi:hypothetical protein